MIQCLVCDQTIHPIQDMNVRGQMVDKCPTQDCGAVLGKAGTTIKPLEVMDGGASPAPAPLPKTSDAEEVLPPSPPPPGPPPASTFSAIGRVVPEDGVAARARARLQQLQEQQKLLSMEERMLRSVLGEDPH